MGKLLKSLENKVFFFSVVCKQHKCTLMLGLTAQNTLPPTSKTQVQCLLISPHDIKLNELTEQKIIALHGKYLIWDLRQTGTSELCRANTIKHLSDAAQWAQDIVIHIRLTALGTEILDL